MKVKTEEFLRALKVLERVLSKRSLPFYRAVYFAPSVDPSGGGHVTLAGSNGDQVLTVGVSASVEDPEPFAVSGEELISAVTVAPSSEIELTRSGDSTVVVSGSAEWRIQDLSGVSPEQMPEHPDADDRVAQQMDAATFHDALLRANYAASRSQSRPGFMQVRVDEHRIQASDGYRFHEVPIRQQDYAQGDFLLPVQTLEVVLDLLDLSDDSAQAVLAVSPSQGWIRLSSSAGRFTTGRLSYPFPDLDSLIVQRGESQEGRLVVDRAELAMALRVAEVAAEDGIVKLALRRAGVDGSGQAAVLRVSAESTGRRGFMDISVDPTGVPEGWTRRVSADMLGQMIGKLGEATIEFRVATGADLGFLFARTESDDGQVERAAVLPVPGE